MVYFFVLGVAALGFLLFVIRAFVGTDPRALVRGLRYTVGSVLIGAGGVLVLAERWGLALPLIAAGVSAIAVGRIGPIDLGGARRSAGSASSVTSAYLDMRLDHDTGEMAGTVRAGAFAGRYLEDLDQATLLKLREEIAGDGESLALLEAYLDRRVAGWREHVEGDAAAGPRGAANTGAMTDQEAYKVLGLSPGADEAEIRAAHRRLMMRMHPDQGGSTFLAAKINEAKDRLLGKHR
jgi:hypothetical protein